MESAGDCEKIRMKRLFKRITALASAAALTLSLAACGGSAVSGPKNTAPTNAKPVTITVWSYYNGDQLETFSKLVDEFNATVGKEQNITVEASSQGSVNDLETNVPQPRARWGLPRCPISSLLMPTPAMPWTRWALWRT